MLTRWIAINPLRSARLLFWGIAVVLGGIQAWIARFSLSSTDIVSYLDIADAYLRADWPAVVNAYWSPAYSWVLAVALFILQPGPYWEFPLVKLVNFTMFLVAFWAFEQFIRQLFRSYVDVPPAHELQPGQPGPSYWVWWIAAYTLFLWSSLKWTTMRSDTPDMGTAACIYFAAACMLRSLAGTRQWLYSAAFGAALGFAFLWKAALFPIGLVCLLVIPFSKGRLRTSLPGAALAVLMFAAVSLPYITALSLQKGRVTFSDAGTLQQVWLVNPGNYQIPDVHYQGDGDPAFGTPRHPTRKISSGPDVYEFATPIPGTYPPWYDPSYWNDGVHPRFDLVRYVRIIAHNVLYEWSAFLGILLFGFLCLATLMRSVKVPLSGMAANWRLLVPAIAGLGVYSVGTHLTMANMLGQPSTRYLAPFIVLLFVATLYQRRLDSDPDARRGLIALAVATASVAIVGLTVESLKNPGGPGMKSDVVTSIEIADQLRTLGLQPGDRIAMMGEPYYWARLRRLKIVAEVNPNEFWAASPASRSAALEAIRKLGVKAAVARAKGIPASAESEGWQPIGSAGEHVHLFE